MTNSDSQNDNSGDKRRFSRINFDADAHLVSAEGSWHGRLVDISLKGLLIDIPNNWTPKIQERFLVELLMENEEAAIRMEVSVAHVDDKHAGLRCEHIDLDSISHLRRLVELNLGDADILDRELAELSHQS
ncbi:MAG: PilZ domain-containing protein [Gammaproteobacteria bacterium]|nr:PilZ domain-containing protein [Gammaproteobacteria bacterium]